MTVQTWPMNSRRYAGIASGRTSGPMRDHRPGRFDAGSSASLPGDVMPAPMIASAGLDQPRSWSQTLDDPAAIAGGAVPEPVVQPGQPALPELHGVRHDSPSAPEVWQGNGSRRSFVAGVGSTEAFGDPGLEDLERGPVGQHGRLRAGPGAEPGAAGP